MIAYLKNMNNQAFRFNKSAIGARLRLLREAKGLTQKDVAAALGMNEQVISDAETAKALSVEKLMRFSEYYGESLDNFKEVALAR